MDKHIQKIEEFLNTYIIPKSQKCYSEKTKQNNRRYLKNILDNVKDNMDNINQVIQFIETIKHEPTLLKNLDSYLVYSRHYKLVGIENLEAYRLQKHETKAVKTETESKSPNIPQN